MTYTKLLTPAAAERAVQAGSDIVVIPYTSFQDSSAATLSAYSELATAAAGALYRQAGNDQTSIVAAGEHTYGTTTPSTASLMYAWLHHAGVPKTALASPLPHNANATPQQLAWLQKTFGSAWRTHPPILVGMRQHWPRIAYLCRLYRLPACFLDAGTYLAARHMLTPAYRQAIRLYNIHNKGYEQRSMRLTRALRPLGPWGITVVFRLLTALRTPNVVHVVPDAAGKQQFYATTVRRHRRRARVYS